MPLLRYSGTRSVVVRSHMPIVSYLALEEDSGRTHQVAFIVCLLHRRGRLAPHHRCVGGASSDGFLYLSKKIEWMLYGGNKAKALMRLGIKVFDLSVVGVT